MYNFDMACDMHFVGVSYTYAIFKRSGYLFYLSVGKKHGNLKAIINPVYKSYKICIGTKQIFMSYDVRAFKKQIKIEYDKNRNC